MEERIARLEKDMTDIKVLLARIDERTSHLPSTLQMTLIIITVMGIAMAIPTLPEIILAVQG